MSEPRKRLCLIPARAGSKGVPHKNIRPFCGLPLLAHSVAHARESGCFDVIALSSDSDEYLKIAQEAGADMMIKRPDDLASDTAGSMDVILNALDLCETENGASFDTVCLLQVTSPLRAPHHIPEAIEKLEAGTKDSVLSVAAAKNSPYFNMLEHDAQSQTYHLSKPLPAEVTRRQDAPKVFQLNGSIYVWNRDALLKQKTALCQNTDIYEMSALHSVDIDTEEDWAFAELAATLL